MIEGQHYQNAYVTRDIEAAARAFRKHAQIRQEIYYETTMQVMSPAGPRIMHNKLTFLWVEDLQYELIEPVAGLEDIYGPALPADNALGFHHKCMRVSNWDDFRSRVDRQPFPLVFEGEAGPLKFLYLDARPLLGHYLEYTWMPDEMWTATGGR
jgi:hypothetical protein